MLDKEFDGSEMLDKEFDSSEMLDKEFDGSKIYISSYQKDNMIDQC